MTKKNELRSWSVKPGKAPAAPPERPRAEPLKDSGWSRGKVISLVILLSSFGLVAVGGLLFIFGGLNPTPEEDEPVPSSGSTTTAT